MSDLDPPGQLPPAGRPLGSQYTVFELLGRGATGEVHRATTRDGSPVAVKLLRPELAADHQLVSRFLQERAILTTLRHPNIVGIRDLVAERDTLAIVMDLVDGQDLRSHLSQRATLPAGDAAQLMIQVLNGLSAVHAAQVVHRDLKPENILLDRSAAHPGVLVPRITDFGISTLMQNTRASHRTGALGTPEYMAPELIDDADPSPASDLYAAGIMLYELLAGVTPFQAKVPLALMKKHAEQAPGRPAGIPDPLWVLISALLAKRPQDRPVSAATVATELAAMMPILHGVPALMPGAGPETGLAGGTTLIKDIPAPTLAQPPTGLARPKRRLALIAGLMVLLLAGGGLVAAVLLGRGDDRDDAAVAPSVSPAGSSTGLPAPTGTGTAVAPTEVPTENPSGTGDPNQVLPDLTGQSLSAAVSTLNELGLSYTTKEVYDSSGPDDQVVQQNPAAGEQAGSRVTLTVSRVAVATYLTDLGAVNGSPSTDAVSIDGTDYSHPLSEQLGYCDSSSDQLVWEFDLGKGYRQFKGTAGMVDNSASSTRVALEIFGDDRKLWNKTVSLGKDAGFAVDVTGVLRLKIVATGRRCGSDIDSTFAIGDPRVLAPPVTTSP